MMIQSQSIKRLTVKTLQYYNKFLNIQTDYQSLTTTLISEWFQIDSLISDNCF